MIAYYMTTVCIYIYTNCIHCFELISFWARWSSASKFGCGGRGGDGGDGDITSVWPTETDGDKWPGALC